MRFSYTGFRCVVLVHANIKSQGQVAIQVYLFMVWWPICNSSRTNLYKQLVFDNLVHMNLKEHIAIIYWLLRKEMVWQVSETFFFSRKCFLFCSPTVSNVNTNWNLSWNNFFIKFSHVAMIHIYKTCVQIFVSSSSTMMIIVLKCIHWSYYACISAASSSGLVFSIPLLFLELCMKPSCTLSSGKSKPISSRSTC